MKVTFEDHLSDLLTKLTKNRPLTRTTTFTSYNLGHNIIFWYFSTF